VLGGKMKKIFFIILLSILPAFIFALPFGLKMGMNLDEISAECEEEPSFVKDDIYLRLLTSLDENVIV